MFHFGFCSLFTDVLAHLDVVLQQGANQLSAPLAGAPAMQRVKRHAGVWLPKACWVALCYSKNVVDDMVGIPALLPITSAVVAAADLLGRERVLALLRGRR